MLSVVVLCFGIVPVATNIVSERHTFHELLSCLMFEVWLRDGEMVYHHSSEWRPGLCFDFYRFSTSKFCVSSRGVQSAIKG